MDTLNKNIFPRRGGIIILILMKSWIFYVMIYILNFYIKFNQL